MDAAHGTAESAPDKLDDLKLAEAKQPGSVGADTNVGNDNNINAQPMEEKVCAKRKASEDISKQGWRDNYKFV